MGWNIKEKLVLITGATDGIGKQTAHNIAEMGAQVVLIGRNEAKAINVVNSIKLETGNQKISYLLADLSVQKEIRRVADEFIKEYGKLDVLFNNAGSSFMKDEKTSDGIERTFALNQLNYFLLTHLLLGTLKKNSTSRIIFTASGSHRNGKINFEDISKRGPLSFWTAYQQSKLANIMFGYALTRRLEGTGVAVNSLNPGFVQTNIGSGNGKIADFFIRRIFKGGMPVEEGASTPTYLISSEDVSNVTGKYFYKKQDIASESISNDVDAQERLWELCKKLTGIEKFGE